MKVIENTYYTDQPKLMIELQAQLSYIDETKQEEEFGEVLNQIKEITITIDEWLSWLKETSC